MNKTVTFFLQPNIVRQSSPPESTGSPIREKLSSSVHENMHSGDRTTVLDGPHGPVKLTFTGGWMQIVAASASRDKL
jgi:hypothetical protein